jgi:SAM-dependent methyltransferase
LRGRAVGDALRAVNGPPGELFAGAASYYARYRPGYPDELFATPAGWLGLDGSQLAADIGCGTGQATIPLARLVRRVVAIDPEPGMLDHARAAATAAGVTNIEWRLGDSTGLAGLGIAGAHLAVFASSWHWTDRPQVAAALDRLLDPAGALVLLGNGEGPGGEPDWDRAITELRSHYLGPVRRAGSGSYVRPQGRHQDILRDSPFSSVRELWLDWERTLTVDEVIGLQFSYSFSTRAMFGGRAEDFARDVRRTVLALHPDGVVVERIRTEALVARRP